MTLMFWIALVCAWLAYLYYKIERNRVDLPGPTRLPIVGCLFLLDKKIYKALYKWAVKYGKAYYFSIVNQHFVLVNDAKLVKELFSMDQISGRPVFDFFLLYEGERLGVINTQGDLWETHRRFTLRHLRDFGFGKNSMEVLIMDEVNELNARLTNKNCAPVGGIKEMFSLAVVNSLWTVVSGKRYSQEDAKLQTLAYSLNRVLIESANSGGILFFLPWLRYIIPEYTGYSVTRKAFEQLKEFVTEAVKEHQRTYQPDTCRDFIDVYLKERHSAKDPKSTFLGEAGEKQLINVVADLFFAGTDTTSTTLAWAILYLATHQEVQRKLQKEIYSITGDSRDVSVADRPNMPYLQATIDEVLRKSSIIPSGVAHQTLTDVHALGVTIPKETMIQVNAYFIHHNPDIWGDPENFRPERFLTGDEKVYKKNENVIPFSVGRRQCLGETLARDTLFLFMANIFRNFCVECDPDSPNPTLEPAIGFSLNPEEYKVIFKPRNE